MNNCKTFGIQIKVNIYIRHLFDELKHHRPSRHADQSPEGRIEKISLLTKGRGYTKGRVMQFRSAFYKEADTKK